LCLMAERRSPVDDGWRRRGDVDHDVERRTTESDESGHRHS
jgi:hypothetical protein